MYRSHIVPELKNTSIQSPYIEKIKPERKYSKIDLFNKYVGYEAWSYDPKHLLFVYFCNKCEKVFKYDLRKMMFNGMILTSPCCDI